jgi:amidase
VHADNGVITPTADVVQAIEDAAAALRDAGVCVEEDRPEQLSEALDLFGRLLGASGGQQYRDALEAAGTAEDQISPLIRSFLDDVSGREVSTAEFQRIILEWDRHRSAVWGFFEHYDAILCPVNSRPAGKHGTEGDNYKGLSYTAAYNLSGLPGTVVRAGASAEGLPVGVQIVGRAWREDVTLALAERIESALGGWQPPAI